MFKLRHMYSYKNVTLLRCMLQVRSLELLLTTPIEADAISRINQYLLRESLYIENPACVL